MRNYHLIMTVSLLLISCSKQTEENTKVQRETKHVESATEVIDSQTFLTEETVKEKSVVERFFPTRKETVEFDTTISEINLSISIKSTFLDSYVINEFETEDTKHIDKYRDSEKHLIIKNSSQTLVDTVFKKSDFSNLTGPEFLEIADFHSYWFRELKNDTIEFFGVISKPETDWSTPFYHFFDIKTQTFKVERYIEERI